MAHRSVAKEDQPAGTEEEVRHIPQTRQEYATTGYARMFALVSACTGSLDSAAHRQLSFVDSEVAFAWRLICHHRRERAAGRPGIFHVGI